MGDDLDRFVQDIQAQINAQTIEAYGPIAFERWREPTNMGTLHSPDGYARITGPCGDTMEIYLKVDHGRIRQATFTTDGCGSSIVCASIAAELAANKTPDVRGCSIPQSSAGLADWRRPSLATP